jgi:hypothetical protein
VPAWGFPQAGANIFGVIANVVKQSLPSLVYEIATSQTPRNDRKIIFL